MKITVKCIKRKNKRLCTSQSFSSCGEKKERNGKERKVISIMWCSFFVYCVKCIIIVNDEAHKLIFIQAHIFKISSSILHWLLQLQVNLLLYKQDLPFHHYTQSLSRLAIGFLAWRIRPLHDHNRHLTGQKSTNI